VPSRLARGFKAFLAIVLTGLNRDVGSYVELWLFALPL
jgi:hypothetical protein